MRIIEKTVILKSDNIVTISQYTKNRLQHLYALPEEKIEIIYPGVDTHKFTPTDSQQKNLLRTELGIENSNFVLFTARNLVPRMGLDDLIIAFSSLANKKSNLKLFIAGGGFLEKDLMIISSRLNLESKIKFLGGLAEDELVKYYQSADLFILPTRFLEGFGIATIEALACGLPVLATPVGGTIEVLGKFDKNLLFSDSNAESMASKILEFIETKTDRRILAKHCRDFVLENYSLEKFSDHTGKFYRTISEKHG